MKLAIKVQVIGGTALLLSGQIGLKGADACTVSVLRLHFYVCQDNKNTHHITLTSCSFST